MVRNMTEKKATALQHAISKPDLYLTTQEVAPILDADPNTLLQMAKEYPERFHIPHTFVGKRLIFPKVPFLKFLGYEMNFPNISCK